MATPRRGAVTRIEGEQFVHRELWRVVERQILHAKAKPVGHFYDDLVTMVFAFLSLEAYLNFVGARLDPALWQNERAHFSRNGFERKLKKVMELSGLRLESGERPLSTVSELNALRDMIAHGKTLPIQKEVRHRAGELPPLNHAPLNDLVTEKGAEIAAADVLALAQQIHNAAKKLMSSDLWWGDAPFGGITMHAGGSTALDDQE